MINQLCKIIATLGPVGYVTAPGSVASFLTLPLVYFLHKNVSGMWYGIIIVLLFLLGLFVVNRAFSFFARHSDPAQIVIDELVGCFASFFLIPIQVNTLMIGFLLFRFFDISKIGGISKIERIEGALGIMLDDLCAALFTNLILQLMLYYSLI